MLELAILSILYIIGGLMLAFPLSTFFHELGHALPALWWTRKTSVTVYLGSRIGERASQRLTNGRLTFDRKGSMLFTFQGLTVFDLTELSPWKLLVVMLAGPICAVLVCWGLLGLSFLLAPDAGPKIVFGVCALVATFQSLRDLIPDAKPIFEMGGRKIYNDGYVILQTWQFLRKPPDLQSALEQYWAGNWEEALEKMASLYDEGNTGRLLLNTALKACRELEDVEKGKKWADRMHQHYVLAAEEYVFTGYFYWATGSLDKALHDLDHALAEEPELFEALVLRGKLHHQQGNTTAALADLKRAQALGKLPPDALEIQKGALRT